MHPQVERTKSAPVKKEAVAEPAPVKTEETHYKAVYVLDIPLLTCTRRPTPVTPRAETGLVAGPAGLPIAKFEDGDVHKTDLPNLMLLGARPAKAPKKKPAAADVQPPAPIAKKPAAADVQPPAPVAAAPAAVEPPAPVAAAPAADDPPPAPEEAAAPDAEAKTARYVDYYRKQKCLSLIHI